MGFKEVKGGYKVMFYFKRLVLGLLGSYNIFDMTVSFLLNFCVSLVGNYGL